MTTWILTSVISKKRIVVPFSKQFYHLRELHKAGRAPQNGSFRYSAQSLYEKGILLWIDQYSPKRFDRIDVVLSSNMPSVFNLEMYNKEHGGSTLMGKSEVRMEELLQARFENSAHLTLFNGMAKFNLELLLYQINKKYVAYQPIV